MSDFNTGHMSAHSFRQDLSNLGLGNNVLIIEGGIPQETIEVSDSSSTESPSEYFAPDVVCVTNIPRETYIVEDSGIVQESLVHVVDEADSSEDDNQTGVLQGGQSKLSNIQRKHPTLCGLLRPTEPIMPFPHSPIIPHILKTSAPVVLGSVETQPRVLGPMELSNYVLSLGKDSCGSPSGSETANARAPSAKCKSPQNTGRKKLANKFGKPFQRNTRISKSRTSEAKTLSAARNIKSPKTVSRLSSAPESSADETLVDKYMNDWQPTGKYQCKICHYSSTFLRFLFRHWLHRHYGLFVHCCMYCPAYHPRKQPVIHHLINHHRGKRIVMQKDAIPEQAAEAELEFLNTQFGLNLTKTSDLTRGPLYIQGEAYYGLHTVQDSMPLDMKLQYKLDDNGDLTEGVEIQASGSEDGDHKSTISSDTPLNGHTRLDQVSLAGIDNLSMDQILVFGSSHCGAEDNHSKTKVCELKSSVSSLPLNQNQIQNFDGSTSNLSLKIENVRSFLHEEWESP